MRNPSSSASTAGKTTSTPTPCCSKVGLKRGPWTPEEDELLSSYINREGEGRWRTLPKRAGLLRCGKSCRLRWMNYLRPSVKRGQIAADEEDLILRLHRLLGNRWSLIAGRIPGRTDNEIKNYWNTHLSKKLISQGIDPRTHKPFNSSAPSSCPPAPLPAPQRPNLSPNSAVADITRASAARGRAPPAEGTFQGADMDQGLGGVGNGTWHNSDGLMMMGLSSGHGKRHREDEMEFCTDDIFSSFLNSLITEDTLMQQQQNCTLVTPSDSMIHDQATNYGYGRRWDGTVPSSAAANEDGHD